MGVPPQGRGGGALDLSVARRLRLVPAGNRAGTVGDYPRVGCERWREAVSAGLDGELAPDEADQLDAHLAGCPACAAVASRMARQHRAMRLRAALAVPDRTEVILGSLVVPAPWWRRGRRVAFGAAAAALVGAAAYALLSSPRPAPSPQLALLDARAESGRLGGVSEVYLYLGNRGGSDRVLRAESPVATRTELHVSEQEGGVPAMRVVGTVAVPGAGATQLAPGGPHVMLVGLREDLRPGDVVPLVLEFARAGRVEVTAVVASTPPAA